MFEEERQGKGRDTSNAAHTKEPNYSRKRHEDRGARGGFIRIKNIHPSS